jgi:hypothetical protein
MKGITAGSRQLGSTAQLRRLRRVYRGYWMAAQGLADSIRKPPALLVRIDKAPPFPALFSSLYTSRRSLQDNFPSGPVPVVPGLATKGGSGRLSTSPLFSVRRRRRRTEKRGELEGRPLPPLVAKPGTTGTGPEGKLSWRLLRLVYNDENNAGNGGALSILTSRAGVLRIELAERW